MQNFDVIIVGAGPAGAACALALQKSNLRVAIVDKAVFPRDKTCGDAIPGGALKVLKAIMPDAIADFEMHEAKNKITESIIVTASGKQMKMQWIGKAYNASRMSWDNFLMQLVKTKTNTTVIENCFIKNISYHQNVYCLTDSLQNSFGCKLVIAADGALAGVSKMLPHNNLNYKNTAVAVRAYYSNVKSLATQNVFLLNKQFANAYFWIFPVENNLFNIGFGVVKPTNKKGETIDVKKAFSQLIATDAHLQKYFEGAKMHGQVQGFKLPLYAKQQSISGHAYMLCGDAAHLIDPLQGHGIDKAMQSGYLAAQQAMQCFEKNNFSENFMRAYDASVYKKMGKELQRNKNIMLATSSMPWLADIVASVFNWKIVQHVARKWS